MAKRKLSPAPGFDGKRDPVSSKVDNVYGLKDAKGFALQEDVVINQRESSLTTMLARRQIDKTQFLAGEWFRRQYEQMRMGSMVIDPSYEPVDISGHSDPIPDRVIAAGQALSRARCHLNASGWALIDLICGQGLSIAQAANSRYGSSKRSTLDFTGKLFRSELDNLAAYLGYAT